MVLPFKRHFPDDWSDKKILDSAYEIVTNPKTHWIQITGQDRLLSRPLKYIADGEIEGRKVRIVFEPEDRGVLTVYPIN